MGVDIFLLGVGVGGVKKDKVSRDIMLVRREYFLPVRKKKTLC